MVGTTASTAARQAGHLATFLITLFTVLAMVTFTAWSSRKRPMPIFNKYGPLVLVLYSVPLIMLDLTRHLLLDHKLVPASNWGMYKPDCDSDALDAIKCLTTQGWLITIASTYAGFALLIVGSFWNANIIAKLREIRDKWKELRSFSSD